MASNSSCFSRLGHVSVVLWAAVLLTRVSHLQCSAVIAGTGHHTPATGLLLYSPTDDHDQFSNHVREQYEAERREAISVDESPFSWMADQQQQLRRTKRDIQDIIQSTDVMFPPNILNRTTVALQRVLELVNTIDYTVRNPPPPPPPTNMTTPTPPVVGGNSSTTTAAPGGGATTAASTTAAPGGGATTAASTTAAPGGGATSAASTTAAPGGGATTAASTTAAPGGGATTAALTTAAPASDSSQSTTTTTSDPSQGIIGRMVRSVERAASQNITTQLPASTTPEPPPPPKVYTVSEIIVVLKDAFNISEMVMTDKLGSSSVLKLEDSVKSLIAINLTIAAVDVSVGKADLLFQLAFLQLSTRHALKKLQQEKATSFWIGRAADVTILITAGFCALAIIFSLYMCFTAYKSRKPGSGNYNFYGTPPVRVVNQPSRNPSSSSGNRPNRQHSAYSSPARAAVTARSNPLYFSHRSVDAPRPISDAAGTNNMNHDDPKSGNNRTADPVFEKNERNANPGRDSRGGLSAQPNSQAPDYKDPRRNRKGNLDISRDPEDVIGDSESAL